MTDKPVLASLLPLPLVSDVRREIACRGMAAHKGEADGLYKLVSFHLRLQHPPDTLEGLDQLG